MCYGAVVEDLHLAIYDIAKQAGTTLGEGVIYIIMNFGDGYTLCCKHRYHAEYIGRNTRECEVTRVGHHADKDVYRHILRDALGTKHSLNEECHHIACARSLGVGNHKVEVLHGVEVVVNQYALSVLIFVNKVTEAIEARHCVEVEAEDKVGTTHRCCCTTLRIVFVYHHIATTRHEVEVVGELIGKNTCYLVTMTLQHLCPCKRRAYGIAIGICMREDNHALWLLDVITKLFYLTSCYLHNRYSYMLISQIYKK